MARTMAKKNVKRAAAKTSKGASRKAPAKSPSAAEAIRRLDAEFMKAVTARDSRALVQAFYAPDAVLMPPNHPAVEGRENIRGFLQGLIDAGATGIKLITASVSSAGDVAWERGAYVLSMAPGAEDRGKYIVCYRRRPDRSWRAVADIFNSDQPGH